MDQQEIGGRYIQSTYTCVRRHDSSFQQYTQPVTENALKLTIPRASTAVYLLDDQEVLEYVVANQI